MRKRRSDRQIFGMGTRVTWKETADGGLLISVPPTLIDKPTSLCMCTECPSKDKIIARLEKPCSSCASYAVNLEKLAQQILTAKYDQIELGALRQQVKLYLPAYMREQQSLLKSKSSRIGEEGELDVRERLKRIVGGQINIRSTCGKPGAGDLQLRWKPLNATREMLVTVEIKTSEVIGAGMMQPRWLTQAQKQMMETGADAGLLLFSGSVDATQRLMVQSDTRLVVVGFSGEDGQLLSGVLHAFLIAQQRLASQNVAGVMLTDEDSRCSREAISIMRDRLRDTRQIIGAIHTMTGKAISTDKARMQELSALVAEMPQTAATMFPVGFAASVALPRERLEIKTLAGAKKRREEMFPIRHISDMKDSNCSQ